MSRKGIQAGFRFSEDLPAFSSLTKAENTLYPWKDSTLKTFLAEHGISIGLDFSPQSLNSLEKWYFDAGCPGQTRGTTSIPNAIGFYFGEVLCRSAGFTWIVRESVFIRGRFEIGVNRHLLTVMLTKGLIPPVEGNKRRQSLWRDYLKYAQ